MWEENKRGGGVDQLMPERKAFTHVAFDLDHTLTYYPLTTAGAIEATFGRLGLSLEPFGPAASVAAQYDASWIALERQARTSDELRLMVWRRLATEKGLAADGLAEKIALEYGRVRRESGVRLFDGVRRLLSDLRNAGYELGLLTNGLSDSQWDKIHSLGIEASFAAIVVAGDIGAYKPDERAFRVLLDRLGADRARALFVGDSYDTDIVGASAVGLASAWIRPHGTPRPGAAVPTYEFPSVLDVREVLC